MEKGNRREFIKKASMMGAGLVFAPNILKAQNVSTELLDVAIVGLGQQGEILLECIMKFPDVRIRAVCDIRENRRRRFNVLIGRIHGRTPPAMYEDYREMLEKEKGLSAVIIATPDFTHSPIACAAMSAGAHVYCEPMMSDTVEGARKMLKTSEDCSRLLQIGYSHRSSQTYRYVKDELIKKHNIFGPIRNANAQWAHFVRDIMIPPKYHLDPDLLKKYGYESMHQLLNWQNYRRYSCGRLVSMAALQLDAIRWILDGSPASEMAYADVAPGADVPSALTCVFLVNSSDGGRALVSSAGFLNAVNLPCREDFFGMGKGFRLSNDPRFIKIFLQLGDDELVKFLEKDIIRRERVNLLDNGTEGNVAVTGSLPCHCYEYKLPTRIYDREAHWNYEYYPFKVDSSHLRNFLNAIRGDDKLRCSGRDAFETESAVYGALAIVEKSRKEGAG